MKLTVLVDNNTFSDNHFYGEPGLSYFIETNNQNILFDLGFSDLYLKNAKKLNIDLAKTNTIILSHGHNDHTQGLKFFPTLAKKINLITHPDCLLAKYMGNEYIGSPVLKNQARNRFNYFETKQPYFINSKTVFLGEIKEKYHFEARKPIGIIIKNKKKQGDLLLDDSALAIKTKKGVVVITGCSHSGICNIINQAREVFKIKKVYSVIGGFHLRQEGKSKLKKVAEVLKDNVSGIIYPAHCSDFEAKCYLSKQLKTKPVFVGREISFN